MKANLLTLLLVFALALAAAYLYRASDDCPRGSVSAAGIASCK